MKWKLEYCDRTEEGFLRTVYIYPASYMVLLIQDEYGDLVDMEIVKLYK